MIDDEICIRRLRELRDHLLAAQREVNAARGLVSGSTKRDTIAVVFALAAAERLDDWLSAAEERDRLRADQCPKLVWSSNGEAGDGQHLCSGCLTERDEPHTWQECAFQLRSECGMAEDAAMANSEECVRLVAQNEELGAGLANLIRFAEESLAAARALLARVGGA